MIEHQELFALQKEIEALSQRVSELEARIEDANGEPLPEECRKRQCTYYQHYLAYGPAELEHEGYHAAEKMCAQAHEKWNEYFERHKDDPLFRGVTPYDKMRKFWEDKVRA